MPGQSCARAMKGGVRDMGEDLDLEQLLALNKQLTLENKKLTRELNLNVTTLSRLRNTASYQEHFAATMAKEKSRQERHFAMIVQNSPDIMFMLDNALMFTMCTDAFLRDANIPNAGYVKGQAFEKVFGAFAEKMWIKRYLERFDGAVRGGKVLAFDETLDFHQGEGVRNFAVTIAPITYEEGERGGVLVIMRDLTDILNAKEGAEAASRAKSDFLATMSHEIRTPLNAIIGMADIMHNTELSEQQRFYLMNIRNSSNALLMIVNDVLDFSSIEAGKMEIAEKPYDLLATLGKLESVYRVLFEQKGIVFGVYYAKDLPRGVLGDEKRINQVLTNLLSNALKYTREGSVDFFATVEGGELCFGVSDTGIGMNREEVDRLFRPFEQFGNTKHKSISGTGLGLAITDRILRLMHGRIDVVSEVGSGSMFTVHVPLKAADLPPCDDSASREAGFTAPGARALIVDDIELNLMVADAMLEKYGMQVELAISGSEALALVKEKAYDIIFMDHMMPEMDGLEAVRRIRALGGWCQSVPIVALTANAIEGMREMYLLNQFTDFIGKPIDPDLMHACLRRVLPNELVVEE